MSLIDASEAHCPQPSPASAGESLIAQLRVAVTVLCLVGVPAIALVGTSRAKQAPRPRVAQGRHKPTTADKPPQASPRPSESPPARPQAPQKPVLLASAEISAGASSAMGAGAAPTVGPTASDPMLALLDHLQRIGATRYRLESVPDAAAPFWFQCQLEGSPDTLEATGRSPLEAVRQVVAAVESRANPAQRVALRSRYEH